MIKPKEGFHLFMTYNPERIGQNMPSFYRLLDKCLVYYLNSFLYNEKSLFQIIFGFLINSNCFHSKNLMLDISSWIKNVHQSIINKFEINCEEISERTFIKFCKNICYDNKYKDIFPLLLKNNLLYFYFHYYNLNDFDKIINESFNAKDKYLIPLAREYNIKIKEILYILDKITQAISTKNNYELNLGEFIILCLDVEFLYLDKMLKDIIKVINKADKSKYKGVYLPLKTFVAYLKDINILKETN